MKQQLPHCEQHEDRDPEVVIREFLGDPEGDEIYFAVSKDFYEIEDQDHYETTYAEYERAFESIAARVKALLGNPSFEGDWEHPEYPEFAVGERVVLWQRPEPVYLRLHHEDAELPILIAFARADTA